MWIYVPLTFSPSVPEPGDSKSAFDWRYLLLVRSATLNAKPMPAKSWQLAWKRKSWMIRLFGRILEPLTADRGVEAFIASLADTRASPLVARAERVVPTIPVIYGQMCFALYRKLSRLLCSSKTSQTTSISDIVKCDQAWQNRVIELRKACLRREKQALLIEGNDFSSLAVEVWGTPSASDCRGSTGGGQKKSLRTDVRHWPTPTANCYTGAGPQIREGGLNLQREAEIWPTPTINGNNNVQGISPKAGDGLATAAKQWPTPAATDWKRVSRVGERRGQLGEEAEQVFPCFPQDPETLEAGPKFLPNDPSTPRRLNPIFCEWLMGWVPGWSGCGSLEMEFAPYLLRMRSALSYLIWRNNYEE